MLKDAIYTQEIKSLVNLDKKVIRKTKRKKKQKKKTNESQTKANNILRNDSVETPSPIPVAFTSALSPRVLRSSKKQQKSTKERKLKIKSKPRIFFEHWCKNSWNRPCLLILLLTSSKCLYCHSFFPFWKHWVSSFQEDKEIKKIEKERHLGVIFLRRELKNLPSWMIFLDNYDSIPSLLVLPGSPWLWTKSNRDALFSVYNAREIKTKDDFQKLVLFEHEKLTKFLTSQTESWGHLQTLHGIASLVTSKNLSRDDLVCGEEEETGKVPKIPLSSSLALWVFHFLNPTFKFRLLPRWFSVWKRKKNELATENSNWYTRAQKTWVQLCFTNWKLFYELYRMHE